jgi:hypothetical protein
MVENEVQDLTLDPLDWKAVAEHVMVSLALTGPAEVSGPMPMDVAELAGGESVTFTWMVTCTGSPDVDFVVTPSGLDENTEDQVLPGNVDPGEFTVEQEAKAALEVEIVEPPHGRTFSSDQEFVVEAIVSNTGEADALDVVALMKNPLPGDGQLVAGDSFAKTVSRIAGGAQHVFTWTLRCSGPVQVHIEINPSGVDENTLQPLPEENLKGHEIIVNQEWKAFLKATILTPEEGDQFYEGQVFTVTATVEQLGEAIAEDAEVELLFEGDVVPVSGDNPVTFGDLVEGAVREVSWTLECTATGPVTLTVLPAAIDENTQAPAYVEEHTVVVDQVTPPYLAVTITEPGAGETKSALQEFPVSVEISNLGGAHAQDVELVLSIEGPAQLAASEEYTYTVGMLEGFSSDSHSWTLQCTGSGTVTITVTAHGVDANTGLDAEAEVAQVTIEQVDKAHLVATVDGPSVVAPGDEFVVTATVANTGVAAALDVWAELSVTEGAELAEGEDATKEVDTEIAGGGSSEVSWTLVCTSPGEVTVTVTPGGEDENTGLAIIPDNIDPGSLTVLQARMLYMPFLTRNWGAP